ncbi:MAG: hypothetical protein WC782_05025 [Methylococcaceae bacterium]|jgi:hypothetical protein
MSTKINQLPTETELTLNVDALCQDFNGDSFYGLEYILEDFFQINQEKSVTIPAQIDWFGLYSYELR